MERLATAEGAYRVPLAELRKRHVFWLLVAVAFIASFSWMLMGPSYRTPVLASVPILLFATIEFVFFAAAIVAAFLITLVVGVSFPQMESTVFGICAAAGIVFAIRGRFFVPMPVNPLTRFTRVRGFVSTLCFLAAAYFAIDSIFKQSPWFVNLLLVSGYVAFGRYLRAGIATKAAFSLRTAAGNAALALLGTLVSLFILELGARYVIRIPLPPMPYNDVMQADDGAVWAPRPSSTRQYPSSIVQGRPTNFTVTHSAAGSRGAEVPPKAEDEFRIVMIGDSFTYGWGVNDGDDVAAGLQRLAEATEPRPVTVVNLGAAAYSPWQELERLKRWGMPLQPDLVVLQLFPSNDIPDTLMKQYRTLPAFSEEAAEFMRYWRSRMNWDVRLERTLRASCGLYNTYRALWPNRDSVPALLRRVRFFQPPSKPFAPLQQSRRTWWIEVMLKDWYPLLETARQEFEHDVIEIVEYCGSQGLPILVYSMPLNTFEQAIWQETIAASRENSGEDVDYEQHKDTRIAEEFFRQNDIPWIPIFEKFMALPDPEALYIPLDGHLNEQGNAFVAELIFDRLVRDGHLQGPAAEPVVTGAQR